MVVVLVVGLGLVRVERYLEDADGGLTGSTQEGPKDVTRGVTSVPPINFTFK